MKENYLEAFVDKKGVPKKFFPGHSLENPLPKTLKEYETFFQTVNKCIEQRGKQIANFLMNRENGAESMGKGASTFSFSFKRFLLLHQNHGFYHFIHVHQTTPRFLSAATASAWICSAVTPHSFIRLTVTGILPIPPSFSSTFTA